MRRIVVLVVLVSMLAAAYAAGKIITTPVAHAQEGGAQPWYASVEFINSLMQRLDHFISNDDRKTVATETMAAEAVKQTKEMEKQTEQVGKLAAAWQKFADLCGCQLPWTLPRTGGGGGNHRKDPVEATVTPAPTATPTCLGSITRWCDDGNVLITKCDGEVISLPCHICIEADGSGSVAHCDRPADMPTPTAAATTTPIPPTAKPPRPTPTPDSICHDDGDWVCINGSWSWVQCGRVWCTTECPLGCSSTKGVCKLMVVTPVPVATATLTPQPWETPVATNTPPATMEIHDCRDAAGNLIPCPPTKTATPAPWSTPSNTSGPGPSATRTPTPRPWETPAATATEIILDCVDGSGKLIPCTPRPPATDLPIATKTPTQVVIPTATLTGPPTITPSGLLCKTDQEVTDDVLVPGYDGYMHIIGGNDICAFKWNSSRVATTKVRCPRGYMCTVTVAKGSGIEEGVYLVDGDALGDGWTFVVSSGTFRLKSGYPKWDPVWNRCVLLANERAFAFDYRSAHHFEVWPFGFDCGEISLITTDTGLRCPVFGMNDSQTYPLLLEPGTGKCKLPSQPFKRSGNVPDGWLLEAWDGTAVVTLGPGSYWEGFVATVRPQ